MEANNETKNQESQMNNASPAPAEDLVYQSIGEIGQKLIPMTAGYLYLKYDPDGKYEFKAEGLEACQIPYKGRAVEILLNSGNGMTLIIAAAGLKEWTGISLTAPIVRIRRIAGRLEVYTREPAIDALMEEYDIKKTNKDYESKKEV